MATKSAKRATAKAVAEMLVSDCGDISRKNQSFRHTKKKERTSLSMRGNATEERRDDPEQAGSGCPPHAIKRILDKQGIKKII